MSATVDPDDLRSTLEAFMSLRPTAEPAPAPESDVSPWQEVYDYLFPNPSGLVVSTSGYDGYATPKLTDRQKARKVLLTVARMQGEMAAYKSTVTTLAEAVVR